MLSSLSLTVVSLSFFLKTFSSVCAAPLQLAAPSLRPLVIDIFDNTEVNALGQYHGGSEIAEIREAEKRLVISTDDVDDYFDTNFGEQCTDLTPYRHHYLHIVYSGSNKFSISLQQHNADCNEHIRPYPETWDSVEAARYASAAGTDIWVPISHFNIDLSRANALALESFSTPSPTHFYQVELIPSALVPEDVHAPEDLASGDLVFKCKVPNTFAFAIDDGNPEFAQEVLKILRDEDVKVTFFAVGSGLADETTNLSNVYKEALSEGHQVGLHSWNHPKMEALATDEEIDQQFRRNIDTMQEKLGITSTYFRPPFGTLGARTRQSLTRHIPNNPKIVMWTIDVEDWIYGTSETPEKQLEAFQRGVENGGDLVVMHYLYESTVSYLREMIQIAKATGRELTTVADCMGNKA